jgi:hypothetical protein
MINEAGCGSFVEFGNIDLLSKEILRYKNMSKEDRQLMGDRARDYLKKNRVFSTLAIQYQRLF